MAKDPSIEREIAKDAPGDYCSVVDDKEPNFKDIEVDEFNLCPPTKCWSVDYSKLADVNADDLSDGTVVTKGYYGDTRLEWGDGSRFLDRIIEVTNSNLRIEYDNGRMQGELYAKTYANLMATALQLGVNMCMQVKELELQAMNAQKQAELVDLQKLDMKYKVVALKLQNELIKEQVRKGILDRKLSLEQAKLLKVQQESTREQTRLYQRQRVGFNDNLFIKLLEAQFSNYAMVFASGMLDKGDLPGPINDNEIIDVYTKFKHRAQEEDELGNPKPLVKEYAIDRRIKEPEKQFCL